MRQQPQLGQTCREPLKDLCPTKRPGDEALCNLRGQFSTRTMQDGSSVLYLSVTISDGAVCVCVCVRDRKRERIRDLGSSERVFTK